MTSRRLTFSGSLPKQMIPSGISPDHLYGFSRTNNPQSPPSVKGQATSYLGGPDGSFEPVGLGSMGADPGLSEEEICQAREQSAAADHCKGREN